MASGGSSISGSEAGSLTARLRSVSEDGDRADRSPVCGYTPGHTPKRRMTTAELKELISRPQRAYSAERSPWQGSIMDTRQDPRWPRRKVLVMIPLCFLFLGVGFFAGRYFGGSSSNILHSMTLKANQQRWPLRADGLQPSQKMVASKNAVLQPKSQGATNIPSHHQFDLSTLLQSDDDFIHDDLSLTHGQFDMMEDIPAVARDKSQPKRENPQATATSKGQKPAKMEAGLINSQSLQSDSYVSSKEPVKYASGSQERAALSADIGMQHVRIHIAALPEKYNIDPLEAIFSLSNDQTKTIGREKAKEAVAKLLQDPFGEQLGDEQDMLYTSHPHNLDVLFYVLLQKSPLLTSSAEEADVILVPYWVNKFVKLDQELEKPNRHDLAVSNFWSEADYHLPFLGQKPHLLIVSGQEDSLRGSCGGHGLSILCHPLAQHLTILTPEIFVGKAGPMHSEIAPGLIKESFRPGNSSVAIPDFANIHFTAQSSTAKVLDSASIRSMKTRLISEAFRARAPLRKLLRAQCLKHADQCVHMEPQMLHSHNAGQFSMAVMRNDRSSWFSLQPPGDSAMRTSLYNSILAGSIPAVFDSQLSKVLPFSDVLAWDQLLTFISADSIATSENSIIEILEAISEQQRLSQMSALQTVKQLIQYSTQPAMQLIRFDSLHLVTSRDDAMTMSLKAALRHLCSKSKWSSKCTAA